ncbi:DNA adenine methylase [Acidithiobacillus sp.]|uniref:DNA adenine methylase n=1 Tax=Acidithiobacillus sp. TaxID=1872118 RepID=UPI003CFD4C5C
MTVRPPFPWLGGKGRLADQILARLPAPSRDLAYIEPFFGGGAVFFARRPSGLEVINDANSEVVTFFRVLRDRTDDLIRYLQNTPYSRELFHAWRSMPNPASLPEIERAARFFFIARSSFAAESARKTPSWAFAKAYDNRARAFAAVVDSELRTVRDRLRYALIEHDDAVAVIRRFDSPSAVFYCDPPYLQSTRRDGEYADEMTDTDHERLLETLLSCEGYVALSGYPSALYSDYLESGHGWFFVDFAHTCLANRSGKIGEDIDRGRTERLWMNPRLADWYERHAPRQSSLLDLCAG